MPFSTVKNQIYTPPPTGSLPLFFSGSTFKLAIMTGFTPSLPPSERNRPVPSQYVGDKEQFNGNKNTGRTVSATEAFGLLVLRFKL